jgi:hypothetical protein
VEPRAGLGDGGELALEPVERRGALAAAVRRARRAGHHDRVRAGALGVRGEEPAELRGRGRGILPVVEAEEQDARAEPVAGDEAARREQRLVHLIDRRELELGAQPDLLEPAAERGEDRVGGERRREDDPPRGLDRSRGRSRGRSLGGR